MALHDRDYYAKKHDQIIKSDPNTKNLGIWHKAVEKVRSFLNKKKLKSGNRYIQKNFSRKK